MTASQPQMRLESDSMGQIEVPSDRYWGAQTQRSVKVCLRRSHWAV